MTEVQYAVAEHIATITLDAPDRRNALSVEMSRELIDAARTAEADPEVGAVVVTGGSKYNDAADGDTVLHAETWDPATGRWSVGASGSVYRGYHSGAILMQNGALLIAGAAVSQGRRFEPVVVALLLGLGSALLFVVLLGQPLPLWGTR